LGHSSIRCKHKDNKLGLIRKDQNSIGLEGWNQVKLSKKASETSFNDDVNENGPGYLLIIKTFFTCVCDS